jgi:ubiquitin-like protein Pup
MAQREQAQRGSRSDATTEEVDALPTKQESDMDADVDAILDEIDEVLEENAEDFVKSFVQKGGQ